MAETPVLAGKGWGEGAHHLVFQEVLGSAARSPSFARSPSSDLSWSKIATLRLMERMTLHGLHGNVKGSC
jgi:hypothetical protein